MTNPVYDDLGCFSELADQSLCDCLEPWIDCQHACWDDPDVCPPGGIAVDRSTLPPEVDDDEWLIGSLVAAAADGGGCVGGTPAQLRQGSPAPPAGDGSPFRVEPPCGPGVASPGDTGTNGKEEG